MARNDVTHAQEDFERCLGLRPGKKFPFATDSWLVRTYGMHFLEAYFPHRELGICLYLSGQVDTSLEYLKKSLDQAPSGRAKYYLNQARSRLLRGTQVPSPEINFHHTSRQPWTRNRVRRIMGSASAKGFVGEILINGKGQFIELAEKQVAFDEEIVLSSGLNLVSVRVRDLAGNETAKEMRWMADWGPPQFVVQGLEKISTGWKVEGSCVDDIGVQRISAGDDVLFFASEYERQVDVNIRVVLENNEAKRLIAIDMAGNALHFMVSGLELAALFSAQSAPLYASAQSSSISDVGERLAFTPQNLQEQSEDRMNPFLHVSGNRTEQVVFEEDFFLDGRAEDQGGLASIRINGEDFLPNQKRGAIQSYFSRRVHLDTGTNRFEIVARDLTGNRMTRDLIVVRKIPEYLNMKYRLSVALPPFSENKQETLERRIRSQLESELLSNPPRFRVLERDQAGWNAILREVTVSGSGMADPRATRILRRMIPAEYLLLGAVQSVGLGTTIFIKIVDPATSEIVHTTDVYTESTTTDLVRQLSGLAIKIESYFPLVGGKVLNVRGKSAILDVGQEAGVHQNVRFVVTAGNGLKTKRFKNEVHAWHGHFIQLGVDEVERDRCRTQILPSKAKRIIQEGDYVHAR